MHNSKTSALSKDTIFGVKIHTNINSTFNIPSSLEEISVSKAKDALTKNLLTPREAMQVLSNLEAAKEATEIFNERHNAKLPENITETPKFHKAKTESVKLSDSAKKTFTRIGERAKRESLVEEIEALKKQFKQTFVRQQTRRARKYNISFDASSVDYHHLSRKIDQYEFLLDEAKRWDIFWDIKIYDPVALEQELEDARSVSCKINLPKGVFPISPITGQQNALSGVSQLKGGMASNNSLASNSYVQRKIKRLIQATEEQYGIPSGLLEAIAFVESGINNHVINVAGKAVIATNNNEALKVISDARENGIKNIDVGVMQLNYRWHSNAFANIQEMLNPKNNIEYAAKFLLRLKNNMAHGTLLFATIIHQNQITKENTPKKW